MEEVSQVITSPDWSALEQDVHCPLCDYNLRELTEPRCPECGLQFTWAELFARKDKIHPYLFDQHPEKNLSSLIKTVIHGWLPRRFWQSISPLHEPGVGRLLIYYFICVLMFSIGIVTIWASEEYVAQANLTNLSIILGFHFLSPLADLRAQFNEIIQTFALREYVPAFGTLGNPPMLALFAGAAFLWPWTTLASLFVFRATFRKSKIRVVHLLRMVVYSADGVLLASLIGIGEFILIEAMVRLQIHLADELLYLLGVTILVIMFGLTATTMYRLLIAMRKYVRVRDSFLTVVASQIMTVLAILVFGSIVFQI